MQVFWMTIRYFKCILPCTFTINNCRWNYADFPYARAHRAASSYAESSCMLHLLFPPCCLGCFGGCLERHRSLCHRRGHAVPTAACPADVVTGTVTTDYFLLGFRFPLVFQAQNTEEIGFHLHGPFRHHVLDTVGSW